MALLIGAPLFIFVFPGLFYFSHEIAMPVAMHPGTRFIYAKIAGDVLMIELKTRIDEEARKVGTDQHYKQTYANYFFEHWRKGNSYRKPSLNQDLFRIILN